MTFSDLKSPRGLVLLFVLFGIVGFQFPRFTALLVANRGIHLEVDAKIEAGRIVEIYVNGYENPPLTTPIVPGVRHTYKFPIITQSINFLRIDLGKISGTTIEAYSVTVSVDGKVAKQYGPDVIYTWVQSQPDTVQGTVEKFDDHVTYLQKGYGPSLITTDPFTGGVPSALRVFLPQDRNGIVSAFWVAFLIVIALARTTALVRGQTLVILAGVPLVSMLIVPFANFANWPDPVDQAVGMAGFRGLSLLPNRLAAAGTLAAALFLSMAAIWVLRDARRRNWSSAQAVANTGPLSLDRYRLLRRTFVVLVVAVIASMFFADVYSKIAVHLRIPFVNDWDGNNVNFWHYLVFEGFRPLRDFWYPYGGMWIFGLPAPWGALSEASMRAAVYVTCFLALFRLCGIIPAIVILYVVLVSDRMQLMWAAWRYLLGINIVLAYVAIGEIRTRFTAGHLLFGLALSLALFFEPVQALYAAPAIVVLLLLDLFQRGMRLGALVRRLALEFSVPFSYLAIYYTLISDSGELRVTIEFLLSLGPHAYSSAVPTDLTTAVQKPFSVGHLLLTAPAALIGAGLYRRFTGTTTPAIDDALIALGIVGFMYFQKNLVRNVDWQFVTPTLVAMLIWLASDPAFRRRRIAIIGGTIAGILVWSLSLTGAPMGIIRQAVTAPFSAVDSIASVIRSPDIVASARDNSYSAQRFSGLPHLAKVAGRLRILGGGEIPRPVYVIGDTPMLYAVLGQAPPFNSNDYNSSPIFEQRRVVDWLVQKQPRFAVWNVNDLTFDAVPRAVRVPLMYAEAAATFVPIDSVGEFAILKRRANGEAPDLAWWRERLGAKIDFGGLLRRSDFDRLSGCTNSPSVELCTPFLQITVPPELRSQPRLAVSVGVGDLTFRIEFVPAHDISTYSVRLDRLWFWKAAQLAQLPFRIIGAENPSVGVALATKAPDERTLY